jgi:CheY-like chemotaxis protein
MFLVVDDEEQVVDVVTNILKGLGYRVTSTTSSQGAQLRSLPFKRLI